jgi:hypothetical protein
MRLVFSQLAGILCRIGTLSIDAFKVLLPKECVYCSGKMIAEKLHHCTEA